MGNTPGFSPLLVANKTIPFLFLGSVVSFGWTPPSPRGKPSFKQQYESDVFSSPTPPSNSPITGRYRPASFGSNSDLTLCTWRPCQIPQAKGPVPQDVALSDAGVLPCCSLTGYKLEVHKPASSDSTDLRN